jgi:phenylpyruvate tautomerase PptA (4-oxalocrotonate tautomerase family)
LPLVKIEIIEGKSTSYKKSLMEGVHNALVKSLKIPETDRFQRLYELDDEFFERPPDRSDQATIIEIVMFPGRKRDTKRDLYQNIVENLEKNPGINGYDIMIVLKEPPLENWGIKGGIPADEINFDFKIKV